MVRTPLLQWEQKPVHDFLFSFSVLNINTIMTASRFVTLWTHGKYPLCLKNLSNISCARLIVCQVCRSQGPVLCRPSNNVPTSLKNIIHKDIILSRCLSLATYGSIRFPQYHLCYGNKAFRTIKSTFLLKLKL